MPPQSKPNKGKEAKGSQQEPRGSQQEPKGQQQEKTQAAGGAMTRPGRGALAPYGGFEPFYQLREEFNRLFDRFFSGGLSPWEGGRRNGWGLDVQEDDNAVTVRAEAPGFEPSDFDLHVHGDQLVLRAAKKAETEEKERGYREWRQQEFYRSVTLPRGIDADKVEAEYRNGVLTVKFPRTAESRGRRIPIKA